MNTWFVLACLCACTFASDRVYNQPLPCPYHVKVEGPEGLIGTVEIYAVEIEDGYPLFMKIAREGGYYGIFRCDEKNDEGLCLQHTYDPSETSNPCSDSYTSHENARFPFRLPYFDYDEYGYPQNTTCPDGSSCKLYCDSDDSYCVVVNAEGYFVTAEGINWTIYESPSMDVFEFDKCDASDPHRHLDPPANICGKMSVYTAPSFDCKYHIKVVKPSPFIRDDVTVSDFYGVRFAYLPIYAKFISGSETMLIRCDITGENGKCYYVQNSNGNCNDGYMTSIDITDDYVPQFDSSFMYDSANYPKPIKCPDNSTGCELYCENVLEMYCWIVDPNGNIVTDAKGYIYTFFDSPSIEEFDGSDCQSEPLPTTVDYCPMVGTIYPKFPECSFHIHSVGSEIFRRDELARSSDVELDFYFIMVNNSVMAVKMWYDENTWYLYRFDMAYSGDITFAQYHESGKCADDFTSVYTEMQIPEWCLPQPVMYNMSEYPVDIKCPNETDGCKLYCAFSGYCVVVDDNGYFVSADYLGNMTYDTDFSFDVFETVKCDGVTPVPAPSTDLCPSSSSITPSSTTSTHSTSSTTPTSQTSQPSINPSLSSASVTKAIISVVAVAIAVALL